MSRRCSQESTVDGGELLMYRDSQGRGGSHTDEGLIKFERKIVLFSVLHNSCRS